jgi:hypothetical protein
MHGLSETALALRARRAAHRVGLVARKTRSRNPIINAGGFALVDPEHGGIVYGWRYDLTAEDVIEYCCEET